MSKSKLAIGINCCTLLLALPLALVACVGADFARGDVANHPATMTRLQHLEIVAEAMGIAALAALPSVVLLGFKKAGVGLIAACGPFAIAIVILWLLRAAFL